MHKSILGAGAWLALGLAAAPALAQPGCAAPTRITERFIDADCADCWAGGRDEATAAASGVLDWVTPGASGPDAPLATAALPEAAARQADLKLAGGKTRVETALPARSALKLQVTAGPAWNGYLGLQLQTRGRPPAGAQAYLALVEEIPAGAEGNAVARRLVRTVAGPFGLQAPGSRELRALRIPDGAKPERLVGLGWWTDAQQRLQGIAREGCPGR